MFIDEARIRVKAGDGGNGCMAFRERNLCRAGAPPGGDGGHGGDVIMESSNRHNTLVIYRYNPEHKAERGEHGMGSNCTGKDGDDVKGGCPWEQPSMTRKRASWSTTSRSRMSASLLLAAVAEDAATSTLPHPRTRLRANMKRAG